MTKVLTNPFKPSKRYPMVKRIKLLREYFTPRKIRRYRKTLQFYSQFKKKGDLCFDVGANIGNRTKTFLALGAKVVCIEPQETCLKELYKLFGNNNNVIILSEAIGEREGYGELAICEEEHTISTMSSKWKTEGRFAQNYKWTKTQHVHITTLDALIKLYGVPSFCKIDVEGLEEPVLRGLTKPIRFISFEFTKEFTEDLKNCMNHLLSIGRVEFNCSIGESMEFLFSAWVAPDSLYKKIDLSEDKLLWGEVHAKFL